MVTWFVIIKKGEFVELLHFVLMITNPSVTICPSNVAPNTVSKQVKLVFVLFTVLTGLHHVRTSLPNRFYLVILY